MTLSGLQTRLKVLVDAEPLLAGKKVLIEDKNNLTSQLETALATLALCVVIAPKSGTANATQAKGVGAANSDEQFEIVIHRSLIESNATASTVEVLDALVPRLHGAQIDAAANAASARFRFLGHELRELGDGSYARVISIGTAHLWPTAS